MSEHKGWFDVERYEHDILKKKGMKTRVHDTEDGRFTYKAYGTENQIKKHLDKHMDKMDEANMSHTLNGIKNLFDKNLDQMKENFNSALSIRALEKLNEMKKGMAKTLFIGKK